MLRHNCDDGWSCSDARAHTMTVCLLQHVRTHKMWHCNGESLSCSNARSQDGKGNFLRKLELFFMDAVLSVIFLTASRQIDHNDDSSCSNSRLLSNARRRAKKMHHNCTGGSFIRLRSPQLIFP